MHAVGSLNKSLYFPIRNTSSSNLYSIYEVDLILLCDGRCRHRSSLCLLAHPRLQCFPTYFLAINDLAATKMLTYETNFLLLFSPNGSTQPTKIGRHIASQEIILIYCTRTKPLAALTHMLYIVHSNGHWHFRPEISGRHFPGDVLKCNSLMKMFDFRLRFNCILFLGDQLTVSQHRFR